MRVSRRGSIDRYYLFQRWGYGVFLHRIHASDNPTVFHNHPWPWFSVFFGKYTEERLGDKPRLRRFANWAQSWVPHRVTLTHGPVWTIFVHGRRNNVWGVFDSSGRRLSNEPWRGLGNPERISYA